MGQWTGRTSMAKLCRAGVTLRSQIDKRFPGRDRRSDGWIGDAEHASRKSHHNPNSKGIVHALDIDENMGKRGKWRKGRTARVLANQLVKYAASTAPGAQRIKYVVYENQIASPTYDKTWWRFRGSGYGHTAHIHISFTALADMDGSIFPLPILTKSPTKKLAYRRLIAKRRR